MPLLIFQSSHGESAQGEMIQKFLKFLSFAVFLLQSACSILPPALKGQHLPPPEVPTSIVEIPLPTINISRMIEDQIDSNTLPRGEGEVEIWKKWWYKYWPDFTSTNVEPNLISVRIPYNYAYKQWRPKYKWQWRGFKSGIVRTWILERNESGKKEVGLDCSFNWTPEWNVSFSTKAIYPSGRLAEIIAKKHFDRLGKDIDVTLNQKGNLHDKIEGIWKKIKNPTDLGNGKFLIINPQNLWVTPFETSDGNISFSLALSAQPNITDKIDRALADLPLPKLTSIPTKGDNLIIALSGSLPFREAGRILFERLKDKELSTSLGSVKVVDARISGLNRKVVIGLKIDNSFHSGWIYLLGDLEYRSLSHTFIARNLRLEVKTWNPLIKFFVWIAGGQISSALNSYTYWPSHGANEEFKAKIQKLFNKNMGNQLRLQLISLRPLVANGRQVLFTNTEGINVSLVARGKFLNR